jgi:hypothetical protein
MASTVVALFDDVNHAHAALRELRDMGVPNADISLVAHDRTGEYGRSVTGTTATDAAMTEGAATTAGAGVGAALGGLTGLLVGLGMLTIPGIGPVLAAGPIGTALGGLIGAGLGAVGGGIAGGLVGALVDMGIPEERAGYYAEGVRRGGVLVTVRASDEALADRVHAVLDRHHAVNVDERARTWRESGWTGYDPNAEPYTFDRMEDERRGAMLGAGAASMSQMSRPGPVAVTFDDLEPGFRGHYQTTYGTSGYQYEHFRPAYQYGHSLRGDDRYRDWNWDRLEPEARRGWEQRSPGTWEEIKGAVRHAWESLKQEVRDVRD